MEFSLSNLINKLRERKIVENETNIENCFIILRQFIFGEHHHTEKNKAIVKRIQNLIYSFFDAYNEFPARMKTQWSEDLYKSLKEIMSVYFERKEKEIQLKKIEEEIHQREWRCQFIEKEIKRNQRYLE